MKSLETLSIFFPAVVPYIYTPTCVPFMWSKFECLPLFNLLFVSYPNFAFKFPFKSSAHTSEPSTRIKIYLLLTDMSLIPVMYPICFIKSLFSSISYLNTTFPLLSILNKHVMFVLKCFSVISSPIP